MHNLKSPRVTPSEIKPVDVLYILGPGHCGSTLLNLCLDRHSEIMGVSEIVKLNRSKPGWSGDENVLAQPFWGKVDSTLRQSRAFGLADVPFNLMAVPPDRCGLALERNHAASEAILGVAGKRIVADASKNPERLAALLSSPLFRVRFIYLVRDGRAVVHAYRRKYGVWLRGYRKVMQTERAARKLRYDPAASLTVRYEDMATNLEATLRSICAFAEIDFEPAMLQPDTATFNGLGGNRMRKQPIERIVLDAKWKTEMSRPIRVFTSLAVMRFNRRHGYIE